MQSFGSAIINSTVLCHFPIPYTHHILHDHEWNEATGSRQLRPAPPPVVIEPTQQNEHLSCLNTTTSEENYLQIMLLNYLQLFA